MVWGKCVMHGLLLPRHGPDGARAHTGYAYRAHGFGAAEPPPPEGSGLNAAPKQALALRLPYGVGRARGRTPMEKSALEVTQSRG